ncbi:MAG: glycosyltransferase [Saprospiraceae bacterium]|nr:glycosyltransferase [Saprospiraceae bacterium]
MSRLEVSVIIPVYQATLYVDQAVLSALQFDCVKEVVVILDDDSPALYDLASVWSKIHDRVIIRHHPGRAHKGAGASRNLGLTVATCPYIAFLDADDWYLPNRFDLVAKIYDQKSDVDFVYEAVATNFETEQGKELYLASGNKEVTFVTSSISSGIKMFEELLCKPDYGWFHLNGLTIKKDSLKILFDEQLPQMQDTDFILRLCLSSNQIGGGSIEAPVAKRRIHDHNRILNNHHEKLTSKKRLANKWFLLMLGNTFSMPCNRKIIKDKLSAEMDYQQSTFWVWIQLRLKAIILFLTHPLAIKKFLSNAHLTKPALIEK